ncbi:289_t:CDS:2 [Acaulospora colombiana]|uniref:289_t:CDS:1 n=1 Tax=Acaulospora colombiana TaxID=27376 RepID=A0ACA9NLR4_9GLOM|nr:289_t:CDS:2 [Acaulospora colombiana]
MAQSRIYWPLRLHTSLHGRTNLRSADEFARLTEWKRSINKHESTHQTDNSGYKMDPLGRDPHPLLVRSVGLLAAEASRNNVLLRLAATRGVSNARDHLDIEPLRKPYYWETRRLRSERSLCHRHPPKMTESDLVRWPIFQPFAGDVEGAGLILTSPIASDKLLCHWMTIAHP